MPTIWADQIINENVSAGGVVQSEELGLDALSALDRRVNRFTILRTIIGLDIQTIVRDAGEGDQIVSLGIGVIGEEVSATQMPDPANQAEFPLRGWIWRARYRIYGSSTNDQNVVSRRIDLDLHSQRKLENGRPVFISSNIDNQGVSQAVTLTGLIRLLYLVG